MVRKVNRVPQSQIWSEDRKKMYCTRCHRYVLLSKMGKNRSNAKGIRGGYASWCSDCIRERGVKLRSKEVKHDLKSAEVKCDSKLAIVYNMKVKHAGIGFTIIQYTDLNLV